MSTWLAQNPELLEAALELVDTWDVGGIPSDGPWALISFDTEAAASTTSTSNGSLSDSPHVATVLRPPNLVVKPTHVELGQRRYLQPSTLKSTHHRRREEIRSLKHNVAELQRQLHSLKRTRPDGALKQGNEMESIWRDIAVRQHQLRRTIESDRAKLRGRVDAQMTVVRGMLKLIQQARRLEDDEMIRSIKRKRFVASQPVFHIRHIDQLTYVHEIYGDLERVVFHPKFHDGTIKFIDTKIHDNRPLQFVIELFEAWTVPFEEDRILDALWQYAMKRQTDGLCEPEFMWDSQVLRQNAELVSHFSAQGTVGSSHGSFQGQAFVKRFPKTETCPPTIITSFYCPPSESAPSDHFEGMGNHGLACIRVVPLSAGKRDHPISRVMYTERFTVTFDEDRGTSRRLAGILASMAEAKLRQYVELMHETVETLLLLASHPQ